MGLEIHSKKETMISPETGPDEADVGKAYAELAAAEQAAGRMEAMLDAIEAKMAQLEALQAAETGPEGTEGVLEFRKLDRELQQLQDEVAGFQRRVEGEDG